MAHKISNSLCFKSNFGWISLFEQNNKITSILFSKCKNYGHSNIIKKTKIKILDFLKNKSKKLDIDILLEGSELQIKIWKEMKNIPYGQTRSYGQIAKKLKTSPRYVGNVCGQNKFLLVIPCHRVIRGDGSLGGFSADGGIKLKRKLLNLEIGKI